MRIEKILPFLFLGFISVSGFADENDDYEERIKKLHAEREASEETSPEDIKIKKSREVPKMVRNEKGGVFVEGGVSVGQAYSAEPRSNPGVAFLAHFRPGMILQSTSWSRAEISFDIFTGSLNFNDDGAKTNVMTGIGFAPHFGYGYSLGDGLMGVADVFAGAAQARVDSKKDGVSMKADGSWGFLFGAGYHLVFQASDNFEFLGGLSIMHYAFNANNIKVDGVKVDDSKTYNINVPTIDVGVRLKF